MKLVFRLLLLAGLIALGYWAWTVFFPNPRTVIRHRLDRLAQAASFPADEGLIARAANLQKLAGFFTDNVEVMVDLPGVGTHTFENRDDLMQAALAARSSVRGVRAKFYDPRIEVTPGNQAAIVDLALRADIGGEKDAVVQELKFNFKCINGEWLISRVETMK